MFGHCERKPFTQKRFGSSIWPVREETVQAAWAVKTHFLGNEVVERLAVDEDVALGRAVGTHARVDEQVSLVRVHCQNLKEVLRQM